MVEVQQLNGEKMLTPKDLEKVLVIDSLLCYGFDDMNTVVNPLGDNYQICEAEGLSKDIAWLQRCLDHSYFMPRIACEDNPAYVQIIPYIVLKSGDKVLSYKRAGHETRLKDLYSIGFGGHISKIDFQNSVANNSSIISECAKRELLEELEFDVNPRTSLDMTLNFFLGTDLSSVKAIFKISDGKMVNSVHIGVLLMVHISASYMDQISMKEEGKELQWKSISELKNMNFEDWSKLVIEKCL